jgi:hypothetical protein
LCCRRIDHVITVSQNIDSFFSSFFLHMLQGLDKLERCLHDPRYI